jgi:hypothetical protein
VAEARAIVDAAIEARFRTGWPLGSDEWLAAMERKAGRRLRPGRPGRKPKGSGEAESV